MSYKDRSDRQANPEGDAEADRKVMSWAERQRLFRENRAPEFEAGDDARGKQAESREVLRINRAVEKFIREGIGDDDIARIHAEVNRRAAQPVDQTRLANKLGHAVEMMVDLILSGERIPRSAAEAANVAEVMVKIAGTIKIDGAALAAAVAYQADTMDRRAQFDALMKDHTARLVEEKHDGSDG